MILEIEHVWIELSDGCRLSARIWMPRDATSSPVPAILEYLPYRKRDFTRSRDESMHPWFAENGYASVRVDMRGSGESDGILRDEYLRLEQDDALEVIAWIARQSWCTGSVGMMGKSWGAYNAMQIAARRPSALKAIIAVMGTDDRFGECIHYSGGALLTDDFWWSCIMQVFNARPPDPEIVGDRWRQMWLARLEAETFWSDVWLRHNHLDDYWRHGSLRFDYSALECPVWFWSGWSDIFRETPFRLAEHLQVPHKITVGPWAHLYPHEAVPKPTIDFLQEALRWWDQWLKGLDTGLMSEPPLQFYLMESVPPAGFHEFRDGRWITEEKWPSPNVVARTLFLNERHLNPQPAPQSELSISSPQSTGLASGDRCSLGLPGDSPIDQSLDSFGSLEFDGDPLMQRVEILGPATLNLEVSVDRPSASIAARLMDVGPDGRATLIARGFLNLAARKSPAEPLPVLPGERYRVAIQLPGTAYAIPAGHKIRVALSSAYWPIIWPAPHPVRLTIHTGVSTLSLPERIAQADDDLWGPGVARPRDARTRITTIREGKLERDISINLVNGEVTHRLFVDGGVFGPVGTIRLDSIGTTIGHTMERLYQIHPDQPTSARARMTQSYTMSRGAWEVRIEADAEMTATLTTFEINASLEAYENGVSVCHRNWKSSIRRHHL